MHTLEAPKTHNPMREEREAKGLTPEVVAEAMRIELGEVSRHFTSVTKMEKEGSFKVNTIRAYARAVGIDFEKALLYFESLATKKSQEKKSKNRTFIID